MTTRDIRVRVNGSDIEAAVEPSQPLVDFLRERAGVSTARAGCDDAGCGQCAVLLEDVAVRSCVLLAVQADDRTVETSENLAAVGDPLLAALEARGGLPCEECAAGLVLAAIHLVREAEQVPSEEQVRAALAGNRCDHDATGIMVAAVRAAAQTVVAASREEQPADPPGGPEFDMAFIKDL